MEGSDIHLAAVYALYVAAPLARDELRLRVALAIVSIGFIVWGVWIASAVTISFNVVFLAMSVFTIRRLRHERKPVSLAPDQRLVYDAFFTGLAPTRFAQLWDLGQTDLVHDTLIVEGESVHEVLVLLEGEVEAPSLGITLGADGPVFLGEMSLVTGQPASTTLIARDTVRVHRWRQDDLRRLVDDKPELSHALMGGIARDLVGKVLADEQ
ncbi:MAG: cyclic nucleotide-binding domain-containing protein [Actinomycetota bacterium]